MVTANPKTAGVARWNFLALWGHKAKEGDAACQDFVTKVPLWLAGGIIVVDTSRSKQASAVALVISGPWGPHCQGGGTRPARTLSQAP